MYRVGLLRNFKPPPLLHMMLHDSYRPSYCVDWANRSRYNNPSLPDVNDIGVLYICCNKLQTQCVHEHVKSRVTCTQWVNILYIYLLRILCRIYLTTHIIHYAWHCIYLVKHNSNWLLKRNLLCYFSKCVVIIIKKNNMMLHRETANQFLCTIGKPAKTQSSLTFLNVKICYLALKVRNQIFIVLTLFPCWIKYYILLLFYFPHQHSSTDSSFNWFLMVKLKFF